MPRVVRRAGLAVCAMALAACGKPAEPAPHDASGAAHDRTAPPHAGPVAPANFATPNGEARVDAANLLAFLRATYGPDARLAQAWKDPDGRERHVCAQGGSPEAATWPSLLAVCADVPDCTGSGAGAIDFFALAGTGAGIRAEAQAREVESGANGCAGDVQVVHFGPAHWGFLHSGGFMAQGYLIGWTKLRAFRAGRLEALASVNTTYDNNEADCDADDCREVGISINADLHFEPGADRAGPWDLVVHEAGVECFLNFDRSHRYAFDAARFRYPVPDGPPDVTCPPTPTTTPPARN
jgi:hypothetical protein